MRDVWCLHISGGDGVKKYIVNEVFYTLQGEGFHSGKPAVFCRFSRCNLWTGREEDRATAICKFCDTDFLHGEKYRLEDLAFQIDSLWGGYDSDKMVVFTGGEPALQLDTELVEAMWKRDFYVAVETNGTVPLPPVDWVCLSPKANTVLPDRLIADEIKLVFPQDGLMPDDLGERLLGFHEDCLWLSPMDGPNLVENTKLAVDYVLSDPMWRLNMQSHKIWGIR